MKNKDHIIVIGACVVGAFVLWETISFLNAVKNKVAGVEGSIGGFFSWMFAAPFNALAAIADLFTGGSSDDPNATNSDLAAAGITNLDGSPVTNAQASAVTGSNLLGIPLAGQTGSALNADGSFSILP